MKRRVVTWVGVVAMLAGCASGGSSSQPPSSQDVGSEPSAGGAPPASQAAASAAGEPVASAPSAGGGEDGTAVVVIGDDRFEFSDLYCVTMGGALGALSLSSDPSVDISLPPADWESSGEDWEAPSVIVRGDEPYFDWHAGGETVGQMSNIGPGVSQVDSYETDGYHATGSATFVSLVQHSDEPEGIPGTFEVTCPRP
jgi:hypothetical protein